MMRRIRGAFFLSFALAASGQEYLITTKAGGTLPATAAPGASVSIPMIYGLATDAAGNVYFSSAAFDAVFRLDASGVLIRVAGRDFAGFSGDGGPATNARLSTPLGVAVDASGNLYIADAINFRVRKVTPSGGITTVAGTGVPGFSGDGGPAINAWLRHPSGVAVDASGNLYIGDAEEYRVRKVAANGVITTVAGTGTRGYSGDAGPATSARISSTGGIAVDASGNLYIADAGTSRVRKVSANGVITTVAGNGSRGSSGDGGLATAAQLDQPYAVAADASGNLYIADSASRRIRKVSTNGVITTVAGTGYSGSSGDGGPAVSAQLDSAMGVAVDAAGNLYIADNGRIRKVNPNGIITTVAGNGDMNYSGDGGPAPVAQLFQPAGAAIDASGNLYIADNRNNRIRKVAPNGTITTVAGNGSIGTSGDGGAATSAQLYYPNGVAVDASGNLYISDFARIRKVAADGVITTLVGDSTVVQVVFPSGVAVDASGAVYVADRNHRILKVAPNGAITTAAGKGSAGYSGDGGAATSAQLSTPRGVAVDSAGNLYIADSGNASIRKVTANGIITTVAGNGTQGYSGDGGPATSAQLGLVWGVAVDAAGNLYIADSGIRKVDTSGIINRITANSFGYWGDGGLASEAGLSLTVGVAVDNAGNVYVADHENNAIRLLTPIATRPVLTVSSTHAGNFHFGQSGAYSLTVRNAVSAGPASGTVTVTEIVPAGLTLLSMSGSGWSCNGTTCTRGDTLGGGSSYPPITVNVSVPGNAPAQVTNQVIVSGGGAAMTGSQDLTGITVPPAAALSISKTHAGDFTQGQTNAAYAVTVSNSSGATSGTVTVIETLPQTLSLVSMSGTGWNCSGASCSRSDPLTAGAGYPPIIVTVSVAAYALGQVTNSVSVWGGGSDPAYASDIANIVSGPVAPTLVSPANGSTNVAVTPALRWSAASGATSYDVYFGTSSSPPFVANTTTTSYNPGTLNLTTTYYWRVVARYVSGTAGSATWFFTTRGAAPAGAQFIPVTPCRVADTRNAAGTFGGPVMPGGSARDFPVPQSPCGIPGNALGYSLNVTVVPAGPLAYLSIWPAGQPQPLVSTLNSFEGRVVANAAIVPAGANGSISVFVSNTTHVILDINGYFVPPGTGTLAFYPVTPCRVADTRNPPGTFGGPVMPGGSTRDFPMRQSSCGIPANALAYSLNMTVVPQGPLSYLSTWPAGQPQPLVSTLNSFEGKVVANAAIVPAGASGSVSVYVTNTTDVVIDINGYFGPPGGAGALSFYPAAPCRVADTRNPAGMFGGPAMAGSTSRDFPIPQSTCGIPAGALAYSLNMTVVPQGPLGYLTTWPAGLPQPLVSTLNSFDGSIVANAAIVPAGTNGSTSVFVTNPTDVVVDINGYFAP